MLKVGASGEADRQRMRAEMGNFPVLSEDLLQGSNGKALWEDSSHFLSFPILLKNCEIPKWYFSFSLGRQLPGDFLFLSLGNEKKHKLFLKEIIFFPC